MTILKGCNERKKNKIKIADDQAWYMRSPWGNWSRLEDHAMEIICERGGLGMHPTISC